MTIPYSQLAIAVDLISFEYKTSNPIIISEKIQEILNVEYSIHQIADYMDINRMENYEQISKQIENGIVIYILNFV